MNSPATAHAREALLALQDRQRILRAAYVSARYGWPETVASAWHRRPASFVGGEPPCRASTFLAALSD